MKKYEGICGKYEYVKNMKEYEKICQYMGFGTPISTWVLELEKNSEHRLHIVSEAWKNSEFSPFIWALGLGKIPRPSFLLGSETWENFDLHPYIDLHIWRQALEF